MKREKGSTIRIAVFDVDRTLIVGTSGEIQLVRFLRQKRILPFTNFIRSFLWMVRKLPRGLGEAVLRNKLYLYGLEVAMVRCLLPEFFADCLHSRLSPQCQRCMEKLRDAGYRIILVSGTLDFILNDLVDRLGAHGGVGSTMEVRDGRFKGRILGIHPFYRGKVRSLHEYLDGQKVDYEHSFGFADSWADVPLLSLFGYPVATNPDWKLRREAGKKGWWIMEDSVTGDGVQRNFRIDDLLE